MQIWDKIRMLRLSKNLSQDYVAFYLDISQPAYHKVESGKTKLSYERLEKLAKLYEVNITEIINSN
jgi:transcriptional regulator with XRE-family HTH domain